MGKIYLSVNAKTREGGFKELGVSNKSRKLQKVYLGVSGKTRLVWQNYVAVTGISVSYVLNTKKATDTSSSVYYADSITLTATISPSNATNSHITWTVVFETTTATYYIDPYWSVGNNGLSATFRAGWHNGITPSGTYTATLIGQSDDGPSYSLTITIAAKRYTDRDGDRTGEWNITVG